MAPQVLWHQRLNCLALPISPVTLFFNFHFLILMITIILMSVMIPVSITIVKTGKGGIRWNHTCILIDFLVAEYFWSILFINTFHRTVGITCVQWQWVESWYQFDKKGDIAVFLFWHENVSFFTLSCQEVWIKFFVSDHIQKRFRNFALAVANLALIE